MGLGGLEPPTSRLSGVRSNQTELQAPFIKMERVKGVEPSTSAWKAGVLPLNYTRISYKDTIYQTIILYSFLDNGREDRT